MARELRAIAVHGGAGGGIPRDAPETEAIQRTLRAAIAAADAALEDGAGALDAAQAAVVLLEDAPQFNAGRGSVPTAAGTVEMDAGLMCGRTLRAGAVALVTAPRNPVAAARLVLEDGAHLLLAGSAADDFASERGARLAEPGYFLGGGPPAIGTERSGEHGGALGEAAGGGSGEPAGGRSGQSPEGGSAPASHPAGYGRGQAGGEAEPGTVGAVVCDRHGDVAAATSTGGTRGQLPGRVGDSPIVGAGVFAENRSAAVSCTGDGEAIMRVLLAHRIARAVETGRSPQEACMQAIGGPLAALGGSGGAIAVDANGNVGMWFNTVVMHRACRVGDAPPWVAST